MYLCVYVTTICVSSLPVLYLPLDFSGPNALPTRKVDSGWRHRAVGAMSRYTPNGERPYARNRETVATESTHPKTLKSSRGPRRGSRLGSGWLWWGGWRCGQWLRGWWGWKLRGGGCSSRSRRPLRGISLPLTHRGGGVNNSPARVPPSFRLCPALRQLMRRLSPRAVVDLFPTSVLGPGCCARGRRDGKDEGEYSRVVKKGFDQLQRDAREMKGERWREGGEGKNRKYSEVMLFSPESPRPTFFPSWRT